MAAKGVYPAVCCWAVWAERPLRSVRLVMVPPVGYFFAAGLALPEKSSGGRHLEHFVVRELESRS